MSTDDLIRALLGPTLADPTTDDRVGRALAQGKSQDRVPGGNAVNTPLEEIKRTWFPVKLGDGRISYIPVLPPGPRAAAAQSATEELMKGAALSELAKQRGQREGLPDNLDAFSSYAIERGKRLQERQQAEGKQQRRENYYKYQIGNPAFGIF